MHIVKVLSNIVKKHTRVVAFTAWNLGIHKKHQKKRSSAPLPLPSRDTEMFLNEALRHSHRPFTALSRASTENHNSSSSSELGILPLQTGVHSDDQKPTERTPTTSAVTAAGICVEMKTPTATTQGYFPGQKIERAVRILSAKEARRAAQPHCSHSCTLWEASATPILALEKTGPAGFINSCWQRGSRAKVNS